MKTEQFETPGPVRVRVDNQAGFVRFVNHDRPVTEIELSLLDSTDPSFLDTIRVECHERGGGHEVIVEVPKPSEQGRWSSWWRNSNHPRVGVLVRVPPMATPDVSTASATVTLEGRYGDSELHTASGGVQADQIEGKFRAATASGSVAVSSVAGPVTVTTASGSATVDSILGTGSINTASGTVGVKEAREQLRIRTASGSVTVDNACGGLSVQTASGSVTAGAVRGGLDVKTASGSVRADSVEGNYRIETVSGSQRVQRCQGGGEARLRSVSGKVLIGVAPGIAVRVDAQTLTGPISSEIELSDGPEPDDGGDGPALDLRVSTVSGEVKLLRA